MVRKGIRGTLLGFSSPFRGVKLLLVHRTLRRLALLPLFIDVFLLVVVLVALVFFFDSFVSILLPDFLERIARPEEWYGWFHYGLLWIVKAVLVFFLVLFLACFLLFLFVFLGNVMAGPFNELLSKRVERELGDLSVPEPSVHRGAVMEVLFALLEELKKFAFYIAGLLLIFSLNIVPGIGSVLYAVLGIGFTLFFLALEYLDYPLARRGEGFRKKMSFVFSHGWASFGFGLAVFLILLVPLVNFLLIPAAVCGGTILYRDLAGMGSPGSR